MASSDAKNSEMGLADVRPHPYIRLSDANQRADFPGMIHPQLDDGDLRPLPQLDERQRQPDVVVEIPAVADDAVPRRQKLRRHFLRRGLAGAAGDGHDLAFPIHAEPRAPAPAAPTVVSSTSMTTRAAEAFARSR